MGSIFIAMRVIDIFCGAGGFSEGFRQAGYVIVFGVDKWEPAVLTHQTNHPEANTILDDVIRVATLSDAEFDELVPDSEIIIGSPPCVSFSNSNRSGKANKDNGINLIKAFFTIVARKKWKKNSILKYWIMENVPNSQKYIQESYTAEELGLKGSNVLQVKNERSKIYNAAYFGVPSRRKRYFCGEFIEPVKTVEDKSEIVHLRHVLEALGDPNEKIDQEISDPNYDFSLLGKEVTDHHYEQKLARYQWKTAKRLKQDKGYMGKMAFPEDEDRPARTVMATMTFGARESMIFGNGINSYRAPTIREIASLMSFPIDYMFFGKSVGIKYRLVGNAVPPKMAYAFAKAINENAGNKRKKKYPPIEHNEVVHFYNLNGKEFSIQKEKPRHETSRFKYHIPYLIRDAFRVELTNYHSDFDKRHFIWDVEIHRSQGPRAKIYTPSITREMFTSFELEKIEEFLSSIQDSIVDFNEFQKIYCMTTNERRTNGLVGPFELLDLISTFIEDLNIEQSNPITISLDQDFNKLPREIAIGFYILTTIRNSMGRLFQ